MRLPKPGEAWRHYKGGLYTIVGLGYHAETNEAVVVYRTYYSHGERLLFVRPLNIFLGMADHLGATVKPRFIFEREPEKADNGET